MAKGCYLFFSAVMGLIAVGLYRFMHQPGEMIWQNVVLVIIAGAISVRFLYFYLKAQGIISE